jgi:RNA polymerase sigma-70 factor (ECF subfamily)
VAFAGRIAADPNHDDFAAHLAGARRGTAPSCRWLYESLAGRVSGYLRVHGAPEPDDLTNEVFLRVFDHLDGFSGDEPAFRSWVFTIAHRLLIDDHRRRTRRVHTVELSTPLAATIAGGDAEADAVAALTEQHIALVLASLPADQRDVVTLRVMADLSVEQVAAMLGKRPGAVKSLQHRAVANLRRRLQKVEP